MSDRDIVRITRGNELWINGARLHQVVDWHFDQEFHGADVTTFGDLSRTYSTTREPDIRATFTLAGCKVQFDRTQPPIARTIEDSVITHDVPAVIHDGDYTSPVTDFDGVEATSFADLPDDLSAWPSLEGVGA